MDYRKLIVESGLRMANSGLTVETWGNISARDPETGLVYLTPSAMQYDTITVDDVVVAELDGKIVLMHSIHEPTAEATEMIVPWLKENGYQMVTVSELIKYKRGEDPQNGKVYF